MADATIAQIQALIRQLQGALGGRRLVGGMVSATGTIEAGDSFTVVHNSTGDYTVTFSLAFKSVPVVVLGTGSTAVNGAVKFKSGTPPTATAANLWAFDTTTGTLKDCEFTFLAFGA